MCTHSLNNWLFLPFQTNDEHISFLRKVLGPSRLEPMTVCLKSTEMLRAGTKTVHSLQAVDKVGLRLSLLKLRNAGVGIKVDKKSIHFSNLTSIEIQVMAIYRRSLSLAQIKAVFYVLPCNLSYTL